MPEKKLYLIDATAFCYRAFYALRDLATSFGQPTNAVYGFVTILNKIIKEKKPEYLAACFDVSRETFRTKKFAEYKIQRPPMPDGLSSQIPIIKEIISLYGIKIFEQEGFEADDVIATLCKKAKHRGVETVVVSSDKDILQLVDENTAVFSPYKDEGIMYDEAKVIERFGVGPEKIADIIALMGDDVDNIPGVSGIGEKTAVALIKEFGSVDKLIAGVEKVKQEKLKESLKASIEKINLNKELAKLDSDMDIDLDLDELKLGEPDSRKLFNIFKRLEFKRFLKDLPQEEVEVNAFTEVGKIEGKDLMELKEIFLFGDSLDSLVVAVNNKIFRISEREALKEVLEDPKIKKISHDLKALKLMLAKEGINLEGLYFDTMIAAYLLNPAKAPYGLMDVAWDYLGEAAGNKITDSSAALNLILALKPKLAKELEVKSLIKLFRDLEMPLVEVLSHMELNGIKLDLEVLKKLSAEIEKRLVKLIEEIYSESGTQFNINSPKQLREILFERLKLPIIKKGKTGPSTDEEVLSKLASKHKLPALLLEYRQLTKLKNTYIDALPQLIDKDSGKIHASFNQTGTETGRLSSSNPNLQNIPIKTDIGKNIRRAVIAAQKNSELISCDYSQIELRILAHLSKDAALTEAFKQGQDIHKATAALIYGLEEIDVSDQMRETAKRVNFGIVYGLTSYGLSRDLGIPVDQAQSFIDAYFARFPRVKDYIEEQIKKAEDNGFVTTLLGRRRYIPEIKNKNLGIRQFAQRQAVNTPIQGSASDLIKLAMVHIYNVMRENNLKSELIMQIHDELVFDVRHEEFKQVVDLVRERMENVLQLDVPIKVEIKKGKNWLEMEAVR